MAGRKPVIGKYYSCSGRRKHGDVICSAKTHIQAEAIEGYVLEKLRSLVLGDTECVEDAVEKFVQATRGEQPDQTDVEKLTREMKDIDATVNALTLNIDPANMSLLNDKLTQLRKRKEQIEAELQQAKVSNAHADEAELRQWALDRINGLADALAGRRDDEMRQVIASYVERIELKPSDRTGMMILNGKALPPYKEHDRPEEGRSWVNVVAGVGFEPTTSGL